MVDAPSDEGSAPTADDSTRRPWPDSGVTKTTPRPVIDSVVRSVCGSEVERLVRLTRGGLHETYRVEVSNHAPVVVRIARRPVPWFTDEAHAMAQARRVGVPTPDVLGVEQLEHDGELLSFSILRLVPGRSLDELAGGLPASDLERLVLAGGELLARVHTIATDRGMRHELEPPDERFVARVVGFAHQTLGRAAAAIVERGAGLLRDEILTRPAPRLALAHGDWLPKHLLVDDGAIVGVIDWEFSGPAPPAFAIDFALDVLGWRNPAPPARLRRCVDVIARHLGA